MHNEIVASKLIKQTLRKQRNHQIIASESDVKSIITTNSHHINKGIIGQGESTESNQSLGLESTTTTD